MTDQPKPTLLITVGSTLFPRLTDAILSTPILEVLRGRISILRVQLGKATIPPHLQGILSDFQAGPGQDQCRGRLGKMEVEILRYTDDFEDLVKRSDMVISHAGSGSILTTLRAGKPLMVVPNTDLMDNHQGQLATELEKGGYLIVSDIPALKGNLERFIHTRRKGIKAFPKQDQGRFRGIMDEMMGFEDDRL